MNRELRHAPVHFNRRCVISVRAGALVDRFVHCYRAAEPGIGLGIGAIPHRERNAMNGRLERKRKFRLAEEVIQNSSLLQSSVYTCVV
jgi:hypothetical protein